MTRLRLPPRTTRPDHHGFPDPLDAIWNGHERPDITPRPRPIIPLELRRQWELEAAPLSGLERLCINIFGLVLVGVAAAYIWVLVELVQWLGQ